MAAEPVLTPDARGADIPTMAIPTTDDGGLDPDEYDWVPRRRVLPWVAAAVAVALVVTGIVAAAGSGDSHKSVESTARREGPIAMPSVLTYRLSEAITLLKRKGIPEKLIIVRRVPSQKVGRGTVVEQSPAAGMDVTDIVTITATRAPDKTPDFVGQGINAARATLSTLDVQFTVDDLLDATVSDGIVLAQSPAAGTPFSDTIKLTVARKPIPTNLGDLAAIGPAPLQTDGATIAATVYPDSLIWNVRVCAGAPPVTATYGIGGHYRKLVATAGLGSESKDPADHVLLEITVDGVAVQSHVLDVQSQVPIDIDVAGHQRMTLRFTPVPGGDPKCAAAQAALGRVRLLSTAQSR